MVFSRSVAFLRLENDREECDYVGRRENRVTEGVVLVELIDNMNVRVKFADLSVIHKFRVCLRTWDPGRDDMPGRRCLRLEELGG